MTCLVALSPSQQRGDYGGGRLAISDPRRFLGAADRGEYRQVAGAIEEAVIRSVEFIVQLAASRRLGLSIIRLARDDDVLPHFVCDTCSRESHKLGKRCIRAA